MPDPTFIGFSPHLEVSGRGHHYIYNRTVQQVVESLGWAYTIAVPKTVKSRELPSAWIRCLPPPPRALKRNFLRFVGLFLRSIAPIHRFLRRHANVDAAVVFLESINPFSLLAFTTALLLVRKQNMAVWFLCRGEHTFKGLNRIRGICETRLLKMIAVMLPAGRFQLLSDTQLFASWYSRYFGDSITVMPIPHTDVGQRNPFPRKPEETICWMAGQQHVISYNQAVFERLAAGKSPPAGDIRLVAGKKAGAHPFLVSEGVTVQMVSQVLTHDEYLRWLYTCDIVLLPYDPHIYSKRTSGVFVECVTAGKIPVVSRGTWMAEELLAFGLDELTTDWDRPDILENLKGVSGNGNIQIKLKKLRRHYRQFHNKRTYGDRLRILFDKSFGC